MHQDRRRFLGAALALSLSAGTAPAKPRPTGSSNSAARPPETLVPNSDHDQTAILQQVLDEAASRKQPLALPPGRFRIRSLTLRPGTRLVGSHGLTVLAAVGGGPLLFAEDAPDLLLEGIILDGGGFPIDDVRGLGLISLKRSHSVQLRNIAVRASALNGIALDQCGGRISGCTVTDLGRAGIFSNDATGLDISGNTITDTSNNGIQVWRSQQGEDGTTITSNRIERIAAHAGGTGQNGNGINVYRAGNVLVTGNRIADCAYTAIRGNAASNIQMVANNCQRLGEVALYAEFGFQGALIANNVIDTAATGISVTNFNEGGRLAVVQGNLIRNLFRREHEPEDKRGDGIAVEADAVVAGNTIEGAPTTGILIGWGRHMREVTATGNLVRHARVGIGVTGDISAGAVMITGNMISGAKDGAIRALRGIVPYGPDLSLTRPESARVIIERNMGV